MSSPKSKNCSYVTGIVRYQDLGYFALVTEEMVKQKFDHSLFVEWDRGIWRGSNITPVKWTTVGAAVVSVPSQQGLFLGYWGEVFCMGSGDAHEEKIDCGDGLSPGNRGPMRGIRSIGGKAYAVGTHRQVYRRERRDTWICIDEGARPPANDRRVVSFESIDGFAPDEIYAAGRQGELWSYDSRKWTRLASPTNLILTNVCCASDNQVYISGRNGTLIRGRGSRWELIDHGITDEDFWGAAWYLGKLYLATMHFVYTLEGDILHAVDFGADVPKTCFQLNEADGVLWSIGAKDVMSFDGKKWSRID